MEVQSIQITDNIIFIIAKSSDNDNDKNNDNDNNIEIIFDSTKFEFTPDRNVVENKKNVDTHGNIKEERIFHFTIEMIDVKKNYKDLEFKLISKNNNVMKKYKINFLFLWFFPRVREIM